MKVRPATAAFPALNAELLEEGKKPMLPLLILSPYQQAERIASKKDAEQQELFG